MFGITRCAGLFSTLVLAVAVNAAVGPATLAQETTQETKQETKQEKEEAVYATFTVNDKTHEMKHAIAFEGLFFDDKAPMIWMTARPVDKEGLKEALKGDFDAQQMFFMRQRGEYLMARISSDDKVSITGWADNLSIGGIQDLKFECKSEDGKIKLSFKMDKPDELGPFKFSVTGDLEVEMEKE